MFKIHFDTKALNKEDLLSALFFDTSPENQLALTFCNEWFSNQPFFNIPTSGSTGTPKTISITRNQIKESVQLTKQAFNLTDNDTCLLNLSAKHIAGKMMLARAMDIGMEITLTTPTSNPLRNITTSFDFYAFVPLQIQTIITQTPEKIEQLNKAKAIIIGGAKVSLELEELLQQIKAPIYATYGMTETVSHIALKRLNSALKTPFYEALPSIELAVDNRNCLKIKASVTNNEWISTNDIVNLEDDHFDILGRIDNIINTGGLKVQAEKIEQVVELFFKKNKLSNRFFIAPLPHSQFGEQVTLFVEGEFEMKPILLTELVHQLEKHEVPKEVISIPLFEETESGKVDKRSTIANLQ